MTKKQMRQMTFKEFLREHHAATYVGTDDDMDDKFGEWLEGLDKAELVELGEQYGVALRS